ncbi:MAG: hypothetical protein HZC42_10870 [Candidatus Eisenbacteria bacterium]|nr:hypothetical protein [Candidatus Eisenbacteria bacterium]
MVLAIPLAVTLGGLPYYLLATGARMRHPLHALLKPSGPVGQAMGLAALAMFLFLWLYPLRKQVRWLAWTGSVGGWMRVHTVAGLAIPLFVAVHAGWRFEGLIGLGFWAMLVVSLSGTVGRYLYAHIPRRRDGAELTRDEAAEQRRTLLKRIALTTGRDPAAIERALMAAATPRSASMRGPLGILQRMVLDDLARARSMRALRRAWEKPEPGRRPLDRVALAEALRLARREIRLDQQVRMLDAARRVFGYWHVGHRPVALTALLAVLVHVAVAIATGMTWFW